MVGGRYGGSQRLPATVFTLALVIVIVGGGYLLHRQDTASARAGQVIGYTPPPASTVAPVVAWVGDSWTGGSDMGGRGDANFSAIVSRHYGWTAVNDGLGGSGYLAGGKRYAFGCNDRVAKLAQYRYDLIFVVNGFNDLKYPNADLYSAALHTFTQLKKLLVPGGKIEVVGYFPLKTEDPYTARRNADIARAAKTAGAAGFVDPDGTGWFTGARFTKYIGSDHYHPTALGHRYLAGLVERQINAAGLNKIRVHRVTSAGPLPGISTNPPTPSGAPSSP